MNLIMAKYQAGVISGDEAMTAILLLESGPRTVREIIDFYEKDVSEKTVSRRMKKLVDSGLAVRIGNVYQVRTNLSPDRYNKINLSIKKKEREILVAKAPTDKIETLLDKFGWFGHLDTVVMAVETAIVNTGVEYDDRILERIFDRVYSQYFLDTDRMGKMLDPVQRLGAYLRGCIKTSWAVDAAEVQKLMTHPAELPALPERKIRSEAPCPQTVDFEAELKWNDVLLQREEMLSDATFQACKDAIPFRYVNNVIHLSVADDCEAKKINGYGHVLRMIHAFRIFVRNS